MNADHQWYGALDAKEDADEGKAKEVPASLYTPRSALVILLVASVAVMLTGQTTAVFDYRAAVAWGLQESEEEVSPYGVQRNKAFGLADTVIYIPLVAVSAIGLRSGKPWAVATAAAALGISAYWSTTIMAMFLWLLGVPGYAYKPDISIWLFVGAYAAFGVCGLANIILGGIS